MKRHALFGLMSLIMAVFLAGAVHAASLGFTTPLTVTATQTNVNTTQAFELQNTGNETVTNLQLGTTGITSGYSVFLSFDNVTYTSTLAIGSLSASAQKTLYVQVVVPSTVPSTTIGTLTVNADQLNTSFPMTLTGINRLAFKEIEVAVDGDDDEVTHGDKIKDVKPGSSLSFDIEVENLFTRSQDIEIEDVEVEVIIKDIDDGDDLDEESDDFDIDAGDEERVSIDFTVPYFVDEEEYTVDITAKGRDKNGLEHMANVTVFLDVEKKTHEVQITSTQLSLDRVTCTRANQLGVRVHNLGANDEDDMRLEVISTGIGLNKRFSFELEEGKGDDDDNVQYSRSISFTVDENERRGTYPITVAVYRDHDRLEDRKTLQLFVEDCDRATPLSSGVTSIGGASGVQIGSSTQTQSPTVAPTQNEPKEQVEVVQKTAQALNFGQPTSNHASGCGRVVELADGTVIADNDLCGVQTLSTAGKQQQTAFFSPAVLLSIFILVLGGVVYAALMVISQLRKK